MGAVRPAILLARELRRSCNALTIITPRYDEKIAGSLRAEGISVRDIGPRFSLLPSYPTVDAWVRCLVKHKVIGETSDLDLIINTSSCIITPAQVYYAQGPMTRTLADILTDRSSIYTHAYNLVKRPLTELERKLTYRFDGSSDLFIANSRFCASMYREWGINVEKIISPPVDCDLFSPSTKKPTVDYVLTTIGTRGKEGDSSVVRAFADAGINTKIFGLSSRIIDSLKGHPNITFLGRVSDQELVELYSNALYTLFAFGHEPFGYIPVESMACGTPVLTYNKQGPSETVIDRKTGWLANTNRELLSLGLAYWNKGYDSGFRTECRKRALTFDTRRILGEWNSIFE